MLITIIVLQITIIQVESTLATTGAKVRRTQAFRVPSYNSELNPKTRLGSSKSTASHTVESESRPIASTSAIQPEIDVHFYEQETFLQPLIEGKSKRVRINSSPNLHDPMAMTQSDHIDPTRDGVFARMVRHGSSVAIGSAIGVGGLAAKQFLFQNNNNNNITQPMNTTLNKDLSKQKKSDYISNPL